MPHYRVACFSGSTNLTEDSKSVWNTENDYLLTLAVVVLTRIGVINHNQNKLTNCKKKNIGKEKIIPQIEDLAFASI